MLATAFALRQETTTSGTVVARISNNADVPDMPALILQQLSHQNLNNPSSRMEPCNIHDSLSDNSPKATTIAHPEQTSLELGQIERRKSQRSSKNRKRAGGGELVLEDIQVYSKEDNTNVEPTDHKPTVTIYEARKWKANENFKVVKETCDHQAYPQACAHYYSAINEGKMPAEFTCIASNGGRKGTATDDWTAQHKNEKWQGFTRSARNRHGNLKDPNCQADEYPPAYFVNDDRTSQLIRWIPHFDNNGAAQKLWTGFCKTCDGNVGNGQRVGPRKEYAFSLSTLHISRFSTYCNLLTYAIAQKKKECSTKIW